jgi:uncharacterized integral membrane protein
MRLLSIIASLFLIILGVSFSVLNSISIPINYFLGQRILYFPLICLMLLFLGALLGVLAMLPVIIKLRCQRSK